MSDAASSGTLHEFNKGLAITWNARGLHIAVVDYHADSASIPWETVLELARQVRPDLFPPAPPDA